MNPALHVTPQWSDRLSLFAKYLSLSLLSMGGAITTVPDMHRYLVGQQNWLADSQFNSSIAIAQASPGPNVLFMALLISTGWIPASAHNDLANDWPLWIVTVVIRRFAARKGATAIKLTGKERPSGMVHSASMRGSAPARRSSVAPLAAIGTEWEEF